MDIRKHTRHIFRSIIVAVTIIIPIYSFPLPKLPEQDLSWKNVTVNDKKTTVHCLFKDSRGIVWVGTDSGLYFYDGVTTHPVCKDILSTIQIYSLIEKDDKLYIGSNNGLLIYEYFSGTAYQSDVVTPKEIRTMLLFDDNLWIGALNGIYRYNFRDNTLSDFSTGLPHKSVYSILRDSRGVLYAGTYNGLARWDASDNTFRPMNIKLKTHGEQSLFVNCMLEADDKESIYIGGEGSLFRYTPANDLWEKMMLVESNIIKSLSNGENGHIFVGTDNGVFDLYKESIRHYHHDSRHELSLADNEIWCIYADDSHNLWAGHARGFSIASNSNSVRTIKLGSLTQSGEGNEIHAILRDSKNNLWFGGTNGVILLSDDSKPKWLRHSNKQNSLSHNRIRSIYEDTEHNIWFATDGGINRYNNATDGFDVFYVVDNIGQHKSNWVYAIVEDNGYFWIGSFLSGMHCVDKNKFHNESATIISEMTINADTNDNDDLSIENNLINDVTKDGDGNIWILLFRDNILAKYVPSEKKIYKYDIHELTGGYPTFINTDNRGRVWCAFYGGAIIFDRDRYNIVKFPYTNSDESILSMGKVGNGMWIATHSNVWRIDGDSFDATPLPIPQKSYTAVYEDTFSNKIYLGGTDEILEVDSRVIQNNVDYKNIRMLLNDNREGQFNLSDIKSGTKRIKIPYGGSITMIVSTLDYSPETVQRYMYKLSESPADTTNGWVIMPEGSNAITFYDLKMGDYRVLVKAVGSPAAPVAIPLTVKPPMTLSWWAILLYGATGLAIIYWAVWYTRKRNIRAFHEQERMTALENVERKLSFLSEISHDLKTPLSMILGPVSLMKERAKDPENRKNLETVYDNAVRLNNMIHRTIELQHLEDSDENLLILSVFDVVEFCRGVFEMFKENNSQKNFIFHTSHPQILIEADAVKFESVITNLLSNACKYSDENATISCGISLQDNNVEIVVSDDGIGISDTDQPLVFQRMFRSPSTSKLCEGTGLGLYLIKRYLELMKGNINLYSKTGQGTSFVVTLPIYEKNTMANSPDIPADDNNRPKILIVEDNIQISGFISGLLKDDFTCLSAENGRSGLAIAASFVPDLIIVDEMMPIMSGLEMVKRLKQNPRLASTPIIMLTAKSDNTTENESIKLGIDVFMGKPFEPAALLGRINHLLKLRSEIKEKLRIQTITQAESKPIKAESINEKSLAKIAKIIEENISDPDLNVNMLCEKSEISNKQLYRLIKKYMEMSPLDYVRSVRLQKAAMLLSQHRFTVSEISYMVGFKTPSYFAKCFQKHFGVKPSQYQSDDETIGKK